MIGKVMNKWSWKIINLSSKNCFVNLESTRVVGLAWR